MAESNIVKFYEDRSVFITGATGFMGKVLVEKLLRTCPGINRLYLLMRPSKGKEVASRLQELISNEVTKLRMWPRHKVTVAHQNFEFELFSQLVSIVNKINGMNQNTTDALWLTLCRDRAASRM